MTTPIAFADLIRLIATAITSEAQQAGMSQGAADDLMARVLKRLGVDAQEIMELRSSAIRGDDPPAK